MRHRRSRSIGTSNARERTARWVRACESEPGMKIWAAIVSESERISAQITNRSDSCPAGGRRRASHLGPVDHHPLQGLLDDRARRARWSRRRRGRRDDTNSQSFRRPICSWWRAGRARCARFVQAGRSTSLGSGHSSSDHSSMSGTFPRREQRSFDRDGKVDIRWITCVTVPSVSGGTEGGSRERVSHNYSCATARCWHINNGGQPCPSEQEKKCGIKQGGGFSPSWRRRGFASPLVQPRRLTTVRRILLPRPMRTSTTW